MLDCGPFFFSKYTIHLKLYNRYLQLFLYEKNVASFKSNVTALAFVTFTLFQGSLLPAIVAPTS
jgi:hypothetical protein